MKRFGFVFVFLCAIILWQVQAAADEFLILGSSFEEVLELEGKDYSKTDYSITYDRKEKLGEECLVTYNFKDGVVDSFYLYFPSANDYDLFGFYDKMSDKITEDYGTQIGIISNLEGEKEHYNDEIKQEDKHFATIWNFYKYDDSVIIMLASKNGMIISFEHGPQ